MRACVRACVVLKLVVFGVVRVVVCGAMSNEAHMVKSHIEVKSHSKAEETLSPLYLHSISTLFPLYFHRTILPRWWGGRQRQAVFACLQQHRVSGGHTTFTSPLLWWSVGIAGPFLSARGQARATGRELPLGPTTLGPHYRTVTTLL